MTKPRSDAKLLNLPEDKKAKLADWLLSGMRYHDALKLVEEEFGVDTSIRALSAFWEEYCGAELIRRRQQAVTTADQIAAEVSKTPGQFDDATIDAIKQRAFELAISPHAAPGDLRKLFMLVLKARGQELDAKELELETEKFRSQIKTNVERGLDALFVEVKGNVEAEKLFHKLKASVIKEVEAAA